MNKRKILIVTDDFPPKSTGGASIIAYNHAIGLLNLGYEVTVLTTVDRSELVGDFIENDIRVHRLYSKYNQRYRSYLSLYNFHLIYKIRSFLEKERFDIIHFHNIHYHISYHSIFLAKKYSRSVFITVHDSMPFHYNKLYPSTISMNGSNVENYKVSPIRQFKYVKWEYNPIRNYLIKKYLRIPDKIFAVSNALKKALNDNGIENIEVIHNGIDIEKWKIDYDKLTNFKNRFNLQDKKVIFFGGRLSRAKGGEILLEVVQSVIKDNPETLLLVVGSKDEYADYMLAKARKMGIADNMVFTGWIDNKDIKYAYSSSILTVVPSLCFDWFPTNILESMACSRPVISTCFGGSKEMVSQGENGFILDPRNLNEFVDKIKFLINNSQKAVEFGNNGLNRIIKDFSIRQYIDKMNGWYNNYLK